jgi:hypothetical protein
MSPQIRTRFFVAVEGQSEQSFVAWLQRLSELDLHIHLDTFLLSGGGYKTMLENAVREHKRRSKKSGSYERCFLIVDGDRANQGDWPIAELRRRANKAKFIVCIQRPNHEGLLLRMMPGMERETSDAASARIKLKNKWESYQKPANAYALARQFSMNDLLRASKLDPDLQNLLEKIGLAAFGSRRTKG